MCDICVTTSEKPDSHHLYGKRSEVKSLSHVWLFATPWTVSYKAPLSMEFSRQEYWSGLLFPSPGDLPDPGIEPRSPALQADALPSEPPGKPQGKTCHIWKKKKVGGWGWGYVAPSSGWADRPSSSSCYANIPTTSSASCSLFCHLVVQLCLTVCDTINCSPVRLPHQWVFPGKNTGVGFTSFSWGSSWPRCWTRISYIGRQTLYHWATDEALPPNPVQSQFPTLGIRKWSDWLHLLRESIGKSVLVPGAQRPSLAPALTAQGTQSVPGAILDQGNLPGADIL